MARVRSRLAGCALALGGLAVLTAVHDRARAETPEVAADQVAEERFVALAPLLESGDHLEIRGRVGRIDLTLPLEEEATVQRASLKLAYNSSPALVGEQSRLVVVLNRNALAELPLSPRRGATRAEVTLPNELLEPGANHIAITAVQEHRDGCSRLLVDDLWTRIDPTNSYVTMSLARPDAPLLLADLGSPAWPVGRDGAAIPVITTAPIETDAVLRTGALVAQGLALRTGDRPVVVTHRVADASAAEAGAPAAGMPADAAAPRLPFAHHVLIGTADEVAPVLGPHSAAAIAGPYLGVHRLGAREDGATLVVSGPGRDDVLFAASAFANPGLVLPDAESLIVDAAPAPPPPQARYVTPGETFTLERLGEAASRAEPEQRTSFVLMLPPDVYVTDNRKAELRVNYGYRANLGAGSGLHIIVNGEYAGLLSLENDASGGIVEGQSVRLPLRLFRPGRNVLSFEPALTNEDAAACGPAVDTGPSVGVFGDTTLYLPPVSRVVTLPDLGLFASLAFPYGGEASTSLVATSYDPATIGAVWTIAGKLAQSAGSPLTSLAPSFGAAGQPTHALLVGPADTIDRRLLARTPVERLHLRSSDAAERGVGTAASTTLAGLSRPALDAAIDGGGRTSERALWEREVGPKATPAGLFGQAAAVLDGMVRDASAAASMVLPESWAPGGLGRQPGFLGDASKEFDGAAFAIASPFAERQTATIITAMDPPALERAVAALIQPATWHDLQGDVSAWAVGRPGAASAQVAPRFALNDPPGGVRQSLLYLNSYMAEHPALWIVAVVAGILVLAVLTSLATRPGRTHE